ncbi:16S rRNA (cytidine(1402)-2'-O)-methyltransferase [Chloroflexota bacterium]
MPTLYIVATPIGNLDDVSLRALRILREVSLIAAEDTRKSQRLLTKYEIMTPLTSYYEHNKQTKTAYIINHLETGDVALVSSAGMPGISDPGYELVVAAHEKSIPVIPIPGASAIITALAVSGLPTDGFKYIGFLPNRVNARRRFLESIVSEQNTIIALEAPHRLIASLKDILLVLGDRDIAACRELTKIHEEIFRGTISQAIEHFNKQRGEFTLVIAGNRNPEKPQMTEEIKNRLQRMRLSGTGAKEAITIMTEITGLPRKELYRAWLQE